MGVRLGRVGRLGGHGEEVISRWRACVQARPQSPSIVRESQVPESGEQEIHYMRKVETAINNSARVIKHLSRVCVCLCV